MPPRTRGNAFGLRVHAQARSRDALDPGDRAAAVARVLHLDRQALPGSARVGRDLEARDVALALQDDGDGFLQLRRRHGDVVVERDVRVPDAGQHVGDRVGHRHCEYLPTHHELFVMPGISPAWAICRRQSRQRPKSLVDRARPAATPAARVTAHLELRRALLLVDECLLGHSIHPCPSRRNGNPSDTQERAALVVGLRCGHDRDVHAANAVDLVVVDLGEHELLGEAERVVPVPVELLGRHAPEVTDAGDGETHEPVVELPHPVAAQRHLGADLVALAELEARDRLLRLASRAASGR